MKIERCSEGTAVRLPHNRGYGGQLVFNYKHLWSKNGICLNCGKSRYEVGYHGKRTTKEPEVQNEAR